MGSRETTFGTAGSTGMVEPEPVRVLVTLHLPLDMHCVAVILGAVADAYPDARLGEDGDIWSGSVPPPESRP